MKNCDIHYYLTNYVQVLGEAESTHRHWLKAEAAYQRCRKGRSRALMEKREGLRHDLIKYGRCYPYINPKSSVAVTQIALSIAAQKFDNHQPLRRDRYCPVWWIAARQWFKRQRVYFWVPVICGSLVVALIVLSFFAHGG